MFKPQKKGETREIARRKELMTKVQETANIIAERGRKTNSNYFVTSAAAAQIINQLKEEGEL